MNNKSSTSLPPSTWSCHEDCSQNLRVLCTFSPPFNFDTETFQDSSFRQWPTFSREQSHESAGCFIVSGRQDHGEGRACVTRFGAKDLGSFNRLWRRRQVLDVLNSSIICVALKVTYNISCNLFSERGWAALWTFLWGQLCLMLPRGPLRRHLLGAMQG